MALAEKFRVTSDPFERLRLRNLILNLMRQRSGVAGNPPARA